MKAKAFFSWSGGKDSALALYKALQNEDYNIQCLLTNVNSAHERISMHGVRKRLLQAQAKSLQICLETIELPEQPTMLEYEQCVKEKLVHLKSDGFTKAIFGDIFLEDLKAYREKKLKELNIDCVFPLWKIDTRELMQEFIASGFKAIIVCVNEMYLDKSFCGRLIDDSFVNDLPKNVDVCGENGEFHSFVFDGPIFKQPIDFIKGEIVYKMYKAPKTEDDNSKNEYGFWFCDLLPAE